MMSETRQHYPPVEFLFDHAPASVAHLGETGRKPQEGRGRHAIICPALHVRRVSSWQIVLPLVTRLASRRAVRVIARRFWHEAKLATFPAMPLEELVDSALITGWPDRIDRFVIAALAAGFRCRTFFEFGTFTGRTSWMVAHNSPDIEVFTLDLPDPASAAAAMLEITDSHLFQEWDRGAAFHGRPEASRIHMLTGDSACFDFSPYYGQMDLIYIDASHSYSYVRSDTEAALSMVSAAGAIVWDDPYYPGVWAYLHEIEGRYPLQRIADSGTILHRRCWST